MYDFGKAIDGLVYFVIFILITSLALAGYTIVTTLFDSDPWNICVNLETDASKVQCMEAHYK